MPPRALLLLAASAGIVHGFVVPSPALAPARNGAFSTRPLPVVQRNVDVQLAAPEDQSSGSGLPWLLDPGTKGGIIFWGIAAIVLPFVAYDFMLDNLGWDVVEAGRVITVGYVGLGTVLWTGSYVFRVANKDMTYAQQLKDYENAVIQKRFEELSEEEVDALMGEIYPGAPGAAPTENK